MRSTSAVRATWPQGPIGRMFDHLQSAYVPQGDQPSQQYDTAAEKRFVELMRTNRKLVKEVPSAGRSLPSCRMPERVPLHWIKLVAHCRSKEMEIACSAALPTRSAHAACTPARHSTACASARHAMHKTDTAATYAQVYSDEEMHPFIRDMCMDHLESERDYFAEFVGQCHCKLPAMSDSIDLTASCTKLQRQSLRALMSTSDGKGRTDALGIMSSYRCGG